MKAKYEIGDKVFAASFERVDNWEICPDCCGSRYLTVIMGDGSQATIQCAECAAGYDPPRGKVSRPKFSTQPKRATITGMEVKPDEIRYYSDSYIWNEQDLYLTEDEAKEAGEILAAKYWEEENKRYTRKNKHDRTWAWNVSYYRKSLKDAQGRVEYFTKALDYAKSKAKETK